jgi:hypothetical protein
VAYSLKSLRKKAWKLHSEVARRSENGVCFTCGVRKPWKKMDAGHYIHKDCLDFEGINIHCQCSRCNHFLHGNLGVYAERMIAEYGEATVNELRVRSQQVKKFTLTELEDKIKFYKGLLEEMK